MAEKNFLPKQISEKVARLPEYKMGTHKVTLRLKDGRVLKDVIIAWEKEIVSIGGKQEIIFNPEDIVDILD